MQHKEPTRLKDLIYEAAEVEARQAVLEHEVAEAAIERYLSLQKGTDRPAWERAHTRERVAIEALIKFKAEEKIQ